MRPLSGCLCAPDGMTAMHNLAGVKNMPVLPLWMACVQICSSVLQEFLLLSSLSQMSVNCPCLEPLPRWKVWLFGHVSGENAQTPHSEAPQSIQHLIRGTFFKSSSFLSLIPSPLFAQLPSSPVFVPSSAEMQRLSTSALTTGRPYARINLSPLFLPVEQD